MNGPGGLATTDRLVGHLDCLARPPILSPHVGLDAEERVHGRTPPHPRTGKTEVVLDPLGLVHAVAAQVPHRGQHLVRYNGVYTNRGKRPVNPSSPM